MSNTQHSTTTNRAPRSLRASGSLFAWRTVDLLTVAFLGVAFGVIFFAWTFVYEAPANALYAAFPPLSGLAAAPWLMAGIVGGLVVRRPGAALMTEVVAALVEMLLVAKWGTAGLVSGIVQGLGAELVFLAVGYGAFGLLVASMAGALAGALESVWEWVSYYPDWAMDWKLAYLVVLAVAGAAIAGPLSWLVTRGLARLGALNAFPPGQELRETRPV